MPKANIFTKVQMTSPNKSMKDLSHSHKTSCNMGDLIPVMVQTCMPGDRFNISGQALVRVLPLIAPVLHRIFVSLHYFFVPYRLLWAAGPNGRSNWENWATNTPVDSPPLLPSHPFLSIEGAGGLGNWTKLMGYMGIPEPPNVAPPPTENVSALPLAAYLMIYNEYYRDQNLIPSIPEYLCEDGSNNGQLPQLGVLRKRAWEHDYYTSCLPFAQKGDAVNLPLGIFTDVPVRRNAPGPFPSFTEWTASTGVTPVHVTEAPPVDPSVGPIGDDELYAATSFLSQVTAATVNDLRLAEALQKWLERAARGGSRYTEWILSMYGVHSSDARLQRPEYINGSYTPITISEVLQTSQTDTSPQGNMAGHGISAVNGRNSSYFCEEFGIIIGIMSIMPETAYQQGINRATWLRINDPSELPNPIFAHLGEQEVKLRELYAFDATSNDLFGYIPRFAEDMYTPSRVSGQLATTLGFWHFGRKFATPPALNQTFIECVPTFDPFAVTDPAEDHFVVHIYNQVHALRPLPKYPTPGNY